MKSTLVIARRELVEKRFVFVAAIAFAILSIIIPLVPGVHAGQRSGALVVSSMLLSIGFAIGLAAILGGSIIGRELSDGRLSFYFAKPVPAPAIWFGKLIAATVLVVVCFGIIVAPAVTVGVHNVLRAMETDSRDALTMIRVVLTAAAVFFLITHVIGTFVRSRSPWIAFDFIAAAICGWALWMMARPLLDGAAIELIKLLGKILSLYLGMVIVAAGAWQLSRGRTDRRRKPHRTLTIPVDHLWLRSSRHSAVGRLGRFCDAGGSDTRFWRAGQQRLMGGRPRRDPKSRGLSSFLSLQRLERRLREGPLSAVAGQCLFARRPNRHVGRPIDARNGGGLCRASGHAQAAAGGDRNHVCSRAGRTIARWLAGGGDRSPRDSHRLRSYQPHLAGLGPRAKRFYLENRFSVGRHLAPLRARA
jgi:ABC-type transport system involved in multi-copper enzyme maturation permease subunit